MKSTLPIRRISLTLSIPLAFAFLLGITNANAEGTNTVLRHGKSFESSPTFEGTPTSYTRRGNDKFSVGYYVKDGVMVKKNSLLADEDCPVAKLDLDVAANGEGFSSVIATGKGTDLTLTGSISASDNGEGKNASDFSGLGSQIIASDYAKVKVDSMKIDTKGFLRAAFISDNHAQIYLKGTTVTAMGANPLTQAYQGYANCADQNVMISPPWVLGIQGGVRAGNMLGDQSTLTVVDSKITSGGWAVLSVDACHSPTMNVVETTLEMLPESKGGMSSGKFAYSNKYGSGYGTYFTGNAKENFYGVTFKGLTYAGIYTGGEGTYKSSKGTIELKDAQGKTLDSVVGKGKPTVIDAVWGFMNHGSATVNILDGTVVNAEEAVFLSKAGGASFIVDNAVLNPASGIILQMIDNDDHTVGGSMRAFNTEFKEAAGWPSESGSITKKGAASAGGRGGPPGGAAGMGGMPQLTQEQQTAIQAIKESSAPLAQAVNDARNALNAAIFTAKPDSAEIKAKAEKPAAAELALALARAKGFAKLQGSSNKLNLSPQQIAIVLGGSGRGFSGPPSGPPPGPPPDGQFGGGPPADNGGGTPDMPPGGGGPDGPGSPGTSSAVNLLLTNGSYKGNLFNGSGYYHQSGNPLEVTIGKAATLEGAISLTETRHVNETGNQNTHFTINEYYYLGHVANRNYRNGTGTIEVSLKDGGKWTVTGESLISKLVVDNGTVEGANGAKVVMKIDGEETAIKNGETYSGDILVLPIK